MTELKITNLNFSYNVKKNIFKDFNLTFEDGISLLLGSNGSGKSTLFKLICGVLIPKSGKIEAFYDGRLIENPKAEIAYIPQNFDAFPSLSVRDVLTYICKQRDGKLRKEAIKKQVDDAIELADIGEYAEKKMRTLSGGTKQRVGIAQSVLGNPKIIIADEPTAGLDPKQRERYNRIVAKTAINRSFIISTHLMDDMEYYENIALISDGELRFKGNKQEMIDSICGKIYLIDFEKGKYDDKEIEKKYTVLKTTDIEEITRIRIYSEEMPALSCISCEHVDADLRDAWQYYGREKQL